MKRYVSPYVYVGSDCNNNCIFCSEGDKNPRFLSKSEIEKQIVEIRKKWDFICFMGKEPTLRKDILHLIRFAVDKKFFQVSMATNGRALSYEKFAKDIISTGIHQITISLTSDIAETHDNQTCVKGSYHQSVEGIKNVILHKPSKGFSLLINVPVSRLNYRNLQRIVDFLVSLGVKEINLLNVLPVSRMSNNCDVIAKLSDVIPNLLKVSDKYEDSGVKILFVDFPPCLFSEKYKKYCVPCLEDNPEKIKLPVCRLCRLRNCNGISMNYLKLYGKEEFKDNK
jgi:MoaA/NifB/PqqE/SkfB family radical SAM enzyme